MSPGPQAHLAPGRGARAKGRDLRVPESRQAVRGEAGGTRKDMCAGQKQPSVHSSTLPLFRSGLRPRTQLHCPQDSAALVPSPGWDARTPCADHRLATPSTRTRVHGYGRCCYYTYTCAHTQLQAGEQEQNPHPLVPGMSPPYCHVCQHSLGVCSRNPEMPQANAPGQGVSAACLTSSKSCHPTPF